MDRQEYINTILKRIGNKHLRKEIEKELSAHIDDREQYYRDCGYDSETAAKKALERMGSPEAAADGLSKVHSDSSLNNAVFYSVIVALYGLIILFFSIPNYVIYGGELLDTHIESRILFYSLFVAFFGKRSNSRISCAISAGLFAVIFGSLAVTTGLSKYGLSTFYSPIIFKISFLVTGELKSLSDLSSVSGITVAPWLTYTSVAVYAIIFTVLVLTLISVCIVKKPFCTLRAKHFSKYISVILYITAIVILAGEALIVVSNLKTIKTEPLHRDYPVAVIMQSDTPCCVSDIPIEDIVVADRNYRQSDLINPEQKNISDIFVDVAVAEVAVPVDKIANYHIEKSNINCNITKKYVYIEFLDGNAIDERITDENAQQFVSDSPENWYKTDSTDSVLSFAGTSMQLEVIIN